MRSIKNQGESNHDEVTKNPLDIIDVTSSLDLHEIMGHMHMFHLLACTSEEVNLRDIQSTGKKSKAPGSGDRKRSAQ